MRLSSPVAVDALVETLRWFAFFLIIKSPGETALASANIVFGLYALLLIPVHGFSETTCSMVSNLVGQGAAAHIGALLRRAVSLGYAVVLPHWPLSRSCSPPLPPRSSRPIPTCCR